MKIPFLALLGLASLATSTPILDDLELEEGDVSLSLPRSLRGNIPGGIRFDYIVRVQALPRQVVDSENQPTGGLPNSVGVYRLGFNAARNVVCYNITHRNFRGTYESPALTATHLHEAPRGQAGPPRIAFPNPQGTRARRETVGCKGGPFRTGVIDEETGLDTGVGFRVAEIIRRPAAFFVDAHSSLATDGAFRGQLPPKR